MREMIDSGVSWIGEIPIDWSLRRIGQMYKERRTKVSDNDYEPLSVTMKGVVPQLSTAAKTDAHDDRKLVRKGDFAINSRSDRRGSCGIAPKDGSVSLINTILCPLRETNSDYLNWLFHSTLFADEFYRWGHGIVDDLWTTNWSDMKRIYIPFPSLGKQSIIASFLDAKCAEIDSVLDNTRTSIELYKALKQSVITEAVTKGIRGKRPMKDSGIEWVGEMPKEWKIIRIKHLGHSWNGLTYSPDDECSQAEGTLVLRSSNIQNGSLSFDDCVYVSSYIPEQKRVHEGDILICSRNGSAKLIGKNALIPAGLDASFGAFMMVYRCKCPRFMRYVLSSSVFDYYLASFLSSTVNQLTTKNFDNIQFCYPTSEDERNEIVRYLDDKCASIDTLIASKEALISELESYKKSLIYEFVTGKKEVPVQEGGTE